MVHITDSRAGLKLFEALDSRVRVEILSLVRQFGEINLNQLAKSLGLSNGAMTPHVKKLEDAGLIAVDSRSGVRGAQKVCRLLETKIIIDLFNERDSAKNAYTFDVGIGHYTSYSVSPTCGLATADGVIGEKDDPRYFSYPQRVSAALIWLSKGYLSYSLPNSLKVGESCTELQIGMELASEAPGYTTYSPSDISFRLNGVSLGFFTSMGEFNDRRGIHTPEWWYPNLGQYGKLKLLTIGDAGCFVDGLKISDVTLPSLAISPGSPIEFTLEAAPDAVNQGGLSLFGKGFGDYDNGITVRMLYKPADKQTGENR